MNVDCNCEFGYELQLVIPYAYYLYKNDKLNKTTSSNMTKELYFFSKNHIEKYKERHGNLPNVPNKHLHVKELNYKEYLPPPYKLHFKNNIFLFNKELLIIHNKFNEEWNGPPINFIDKITLEKIFDYCCNKYTVVYLRAQSKNIVPDNSKIYELNEYNLLDKYNIIDGNKLYSEAKNKYSINNFNHFQLLLHANCNNFISVQGGTAIFCSYFGGTNIIFAKKGGELGCGSYDGHFKKMSNCNILHSNDYNKFFELIKINF
jgi:hypothetical protein